MGNENISGKASQAYSSARDNQYVRRLIEDDELREAMREKGLGTPATRAAIIEGLISERYIHRDGKELIPTAKAFSLMTLLHGLGVPLERVETVSQVVPGARSLRVDLHRATLGRRGARKVTEFDVSDISCQIASFVPRGPKAEGKQITLNWIFPDAGETFVTNLENAALTYIAGVQAPNAAATITLSRDVLNRVIAAQTTIADAIKAGQASVTGDAMKFEELMGLMDEFPRVFEVVEPKRTIAT